MGSGPESGGLPSAAEENGAAAFVLTGTLPAVEFWFFGGWWMCDWMVVTYK